MGTFEDFLGYARDVAKNIAQQSGEIVDISKLKFEMKDLEKERKECYENIGKMYCKSLKDGVDYSDKSKSIIYRIQNIDARINELSALISDRISKPSDNNETL